jgi:2-amino-4-hydroxy-6-hydroxymethyldihydropteridine diphosphokinase
MMDCSEKIYLSLGSNRGDSVTIIRKAIRQLSSLLSSMRSASLYYTKPMYVVEQSAFINTAVCGYTEKGPEDLLIAIQEIESDFGRDRSREDRHGQRFLDIDILLYGSYVYHSSTLNIPHIGLTERKFALLPLLELDPFVVSPVNGCAYAQIASKLGDQGIYHVDYSPYTCDIRGGLHGTRSCRIAAPFSASRV